MRTAHPGAEEMQRWVVAALAAGMAGGAGVALAGGSGLSYVSPGGPALHGAGGCTLETVELEPVEAEFRPVGIRAQPAGWEAPHAAALAFYDFHGAAYQATGPVTELVGFLLRSEQGRYFFTTAAEVPFAFELRARIVRPRGWTVHGLLHTHPGGRACQEEFSTEDRDAVLRGATLRSYVRTPAGNVLFLDRRLAMTTATRRGAAGVPVCPPDNPCLAAHGSTPAVAQSSR